MKSKAALAPEQQSRRSKTVLALRWLAGVTLRTLQTLAGAINVIGSFGATGPGPGPAPEFKKRPNYRP